MPQIRVNEEVHEKVTKIADANYRGIGDQVAYWADHDCVHPSEMREDRTVRVALVEDGKTGADETLRVFYCKQCKRLIVIDDAGIGERLEKIIS